MHNIKCSMRELICQWRENLDPHVDVKEVRVKFALMAVGIRSAKASQQRSSTAFRRKRANSALSEA